MSCLSKSFYPPVPAPNVCVKVCVEVCAASIFYVHLDCLLLYLFTQGPSQKHEKWTAILEQMVFSLLVPPGDFPPDRGHDRAGQSPSSCSWGTCGPKHSPDAGRSERIRGRRSFRCTSYPGSLRSVGKINRGT